MDRALSLFRIFDIAFFAPGAVIFAAIHQTGWFAWRTDDPSTTTTVGGLLFLVISLGTVYIIGLVIHGLQRFLLHKRLRKPAARNPAKQSWFIELDKEHLHELRLYFWYLRATCFNLVFALPIAGGILAINEVFYSSDPNVVGIVVGLAVIIVAALALFWLGNDFNRALASGADVTPPHAADTAQTPPPPQPPAASS